MDNNELITEIWKRYHYMGNILFQLESVRHDEDQWSFSLIPMLSILAEKSIKMYVSTVENDVKVYETKLHTLIKKMYQQEIITKEEFETLEELRNARNEYFHWSEDFNWLEINGKFFPLSEADTHQFLYDRLSWRTLSIILKLLKL